MKNIHKINDNIYITNSKEIKQGDWHLVWLRDKWEVLNYMPSIGYRKECLGKEVCKIILTTNLDLIKNGVQQIDDDFLEWFVKNPSCEEVEVDWVDFSQSYFIKIPKQETVEEAAEKYENKDQHKRSKLDFIAGVKWQKERSYNEEEVIKINLDYSQYLGRNQGGWVNFKEWFEQFKKQIK